MLYVLEYVCVVCAICIYCIYVFNVCMYMYVVYLHVCVYVCICICIRVSKRTSLRAYSLFAVLSSIPWVFSSPYSLPPWPLCWSFPCLHLVCLLLNRHVHYPNYLRYAYCCGTCLGESVMTWRRTRWPAQLRAPPPTIPPQISCPQPTRS